MSNGLTTDPGLSIPTGLAPSEGLAAPLGYIPLPFGSTIVYAGDSITAQSETNTSTNIYSNVRGYAGWAQRASNHRGFMPQAGNQGVAGDTSTQLLARYSAVTALNPAVVGLLIGTNDVGAAGSTPTAETTCLSNIDSMIAANRAIGAKTVLIKILPRGSVASPMTANQRRCWNAINAGIAARAASDIPVLDLESIIGTMDANHTMLPNASSSNDYLHPNPVYSRLLGEYVANTIDILIDPGSILFTSNSDPANLNTNGFMTGNVSGVATGYTEAHSLGGATVVMSKEVRSDGYGDWQVFTISGNYTGSAKFARIRRSINLTGVVNAGDTIVQFFDAEVAAGQTNIASVLVQTTFGTQVNAAMQYATQETMPDGWTYTLRAPPLLVAANAGTVSQDIIIYFLNQAGTAAINGVVKVGRIGLKKL